MITVMVVQSSNRGDDYVVSSRCSHDENCDLVDHAIRFSLHLRRCMNVTIIPLDCMDWVWSNRSSIKMDRPNTIIRYYLVKTNKYHLDQPNPEIKYDLQMCRYRIIFSIPVLFDTVYTSLFIYTAYCLIVEQSWIDIVLQVIPLEKLWFLHHNRPLC